MSARLMSSHMSARLMSSHLFSLFLHLLSSSHISLADLSSCQLVSPHLSSSQRTLKSSQLFSGPKPAQNKDLGAKASGPYAFHRKDLTQRTFTHSKLCHREACTHRSFYTETRKLLHTDSEACSQRQGSFYSQQAFSQSKLLHTEPVLATLFCLGNGSWKP